jgi:PH (Pleckstrin Homology) domain-containing protein
MPTVFRLAPMSRSLQGLTWALFVLTVALLYQALRSPEPTRSVLLGTVAFVGLTYASVWFVWRPTGFEIDSGVLRIVWPIRSRTIPRSAVIDVRIVNGAEFRAEYGYGLRIGAGGLWGGFGLLKMRRTTFSMWISRLDRFVIVDLRGAHPLLVTPEDPERFAALLRA